MRTGLITQIGLSLFLALSFFPLSAQDSEEGSEARAALDHLLAPLDKNLVPTGFLRDYAIEMVEMDSYDGMALTDSNYVSFPTCINLMRTIKSSAVRSNPFGTITDILDDFEGEYLGTNMPVGVVLYRYDYIRADALTGGYLTYSDGQVYDKYDTQSNWLNPYLQKYAFGFSPYSNILKDQHVLYDFQEFFYSNVGQEIIKFEFDSGTGSGYSDITSSRQFSCTYFSEGEYEIKLRVTLPNLTVLETHSRIYVCGLHYQLDADLPTPSFVDRVDTIYCSSPYMGSAPKAYVSYACVEGRDHVEKPFIIVEGCDPKFAWPADSLWGNTTFRSVYVDLPDSVKTNYDVVYVDWDDSNTYIQANGNLLIDIINHINEEKGESAERNVLFAQSMGGLVARYALKTMEINNQSHEVSLFISHDVPYLGANVPIGAQYALQDFANDFRIGLLSVRGLMKTLDVFGVNFAETFDGAAEFLNSPSARQMLINYVNPNGQIDNSVHQTFLNDMFQLGWPQGDDGFPMTLAACSNGAAQTYGSRYPILHFGVDVSTGFVTDLVSYLFSPLIEQLLEHTTLNINMAFWSILPGKSTMYADFHIFPHLSAGCPLYDLNVGYRKDLLWFIPLNTDLYSREVDAPSGIVPVDAVSGSYYYMSSPDLVSNEIPVIGSISFTVDMADKFLFVPTASSLCIGKGAYELNLAKYNATYTTGDYGQTPFDCILPSATSEQHITITDEMEYWISDLLTRGVRGPYFGQSGTRYMVLCSHPNAIAWSTSDPSIATINSNGVLSVHSSGFVTVNAYDLNYDTVDTLRIMTGIPPYSLSVRTNRFLGEIYASASCLAPEYAASFLTKVPLTYEWGIKVGNGAISWTTYHSQFNTFSWSEQAASTIYFRAKYGNVVGSTYSQTVNRWNHLLPMDPIVPIIINGDGSAFCGDDDGDGYSMVKSVTEGGRCDFSYIIDQTIRLDVENYMTTREFLLLLLDNQQFVNILHQLKPWGEKEFLFIPLTAVDNSTGESYSTLLKFVYKEDIEQL